jgi:Succinyl-CoA synthetase, alpha subunit
MIYVPAKFAAAAILEAFDASIELFVCIQREFQFRICLRSEKN